MRVAPTAACGVRAVIGGEPECCVVGDAVGSQQGACEAIATRRLEPYVWRPVKVTAVEVAASWEGPIGTVYLQLARVRSLPICASICEIVPR